MNSSEKDYSRLYQLQDKFLSWWLTLDLPFYLTGGTALGRFYLNHRLSEDLDFFINADNRYPQYMANLKNKMAGKFNVDIQQSLFTEDYSRFFINEGDTTLKIEFVNDVEERLYTFPVEWLENVNWLLTSPDIEFFKKTLRTISDDFLLGQPNSVGKLHPPISKAKPF